MPSTNECHYIAGFFDGEGTIGLSMPKHLRIEVSVSQKTGVVPALYKRNFGGEVYYYNDVYQWKIFGSAAINFLRELKALLIVKRDEAEEAVRIYDVYQADHEAAKPLMEVWRKGRPRAKADDELTT